MSVWAQLVEFDPEEMETLFSKVLEKYGQAFRPVKVDGKTVTVQLKDGRWVKINVGEVN
jgi:hypothetical protein